MLFQPNDKFAIMPIFVYQRTKDGDPQARLEPVGFVWREAGSLLYQISLSGVRGRLRSHAQPEWAIRWLAAQVHHCAANRSGKEVLQPAGLRTFLTYANWSDGLRGFVGGSPISPNERLDLRSSGRNLVVEQKQNAGESWQLALHTGSSCRLLQHWRTSRTTHALGDRYHVVFHVGISDLPE